MSQSPEVQPEQSDDEPLAARLTDADVVAYLEARPDFLVANSDVLTVLELPNRMGGDSVTDFHTYALSALREKVQLLQSVQDDLTGIIRDNIRTQETIHDAVLDAMEAPNEEAFLHSVLQRWTDILDVEAVALGLVTPPEERLKSGNLSAMTPEQIAERFRGDEDGEEDLDTVFLNLDEDEALFGPAAPLIKSCVLLRMKHDGADVGILALGWRARDGFGPGRGTETLQFLARSLAALFRA